MWFEKVPWHKRAWPDKRPKTSCYSPISSKPFSKVRPKIGSSQRTSFTYGSELTFCYSKTGGRAWRNVAGSWPVVWKISPVERVSRSKSIRQAHTSIQFLLFLRKSVYGILHSQRENQSLIIETMPAVSIIIPVYNIGKYLENVSTRSLPKHSLI